MAHNSVIDEKKKDITVTGHTPDPDTSPSGGFFQLFHQKVPLGLWFRARTWTQITRDNHDNEVLGWIDTEAQVHS